jgi:actin related protein 2/3 complex subunit 2
MILLEHINTITHDLIIGWLNNPEQASSPIETKCSDFDGCQLHVWSSGDIVNVSLKSGAALSLLSNGGQEVLQQTYGTSFVQPEPGYDAQISQSASGLVSPQDKEAFATRMSQLKSTLYSAPIMRCVNAAASGQVLPGITDVPIRSHNERMWVKQDDTERITIIFSVDFTDPDDVVFGRVFLNEIKKPISGAPTVDYSFKTPPMELKGINQLPPSENVSYVTFVLFKRHWTPLAKALPSTFTLVSFRNYLHYHIKCCKSYLHTRMRLQVENLLKVLNRAKQDTPKEKKLASGRTFTRK